MLQKFTNTANPLKNLKTKNRDGGERPAFLNPHHPMPNYRVEDDDKIWYVIALVLVLALIGLVEGVIWIVEFIKYLLTILDVYFNIS